MRGMIIAAVLALGACGQQATQRETEEAQAVAASSALDLSIGPGGAAGISSALPMSVEAVRAAAANYSVTEIEGQAEGDTYRAITLSAGGAEVFRLMPTTDATRVHGIVTTSPRARGPAGEVIGETLFGVAPPEQVAFCIAQIVDAAPGFACSASEGGSFWRVYRLPEGAAPSVAFADIEPDLLHDSMLAEMRWIAPRV